MSDTVILDGELSLTNQLDGEAGTVIEVGHGTGIDTIVFNADYTLTFDMTNGETFTTGSIRGEQGQQGEPGDDYDLTEQDKQDIAGLVDTPVDDVQINGTSILNNKVANVPIASDSQVGAVKVATSNATLKGIYIDSSGTLRIAPPTSARIKAGVASEIPITLDKQHESAFYGIAKSAGDTTQSQSSNAVGTYTESAKSAISDMLNGSVSVSGTTPTIVAKSGIRYVCGEVSTLDFTPPASGICDVVFTSGSTPTVVTLPNTVKFPDGAFTAEADTTYEINILDGIYGAVMAWT